MKTEDKDARIAAIEAQLAAIPKPDMVSMSEGTIHLDYEDDDARREAYEWLERYAYSSAPEAQHTDDKAVDRFAAAMKRKLAQKREEGRSGWDDREQCSAQYLSSLLRSHVEKGDPLDVGNLAMMLHQRGESISPAPAPEARQEPVACFTECATEGCNSPSSTYFVRGGVGSYYCAACYLKVQAIPHAFTRPLEQAVTEAMVERMCRTPFIEGFTPTTDEWQRCETVQDQYDLMKSRIREGMDALKAAMEAQDE